MRVFIRHPADIPIEICVENVNLLNEEPLNNISVGGLAFRSDKAFDKHTLIKVRIPVIHPEFEARGKVVWCKKDGDFYDIGVEFIEIKDSFRIRMVEQICHIEHYKKEIHEKEGRILSGKEAAFEWINKYADSFQKEISEEITK